MATQTIPLPAQPQPTIAEDVTTSQEVNPLSPAAFADYPIYSLIHVGSGTYSDPLTFASAPGEFSTCEVIYVPYLKKYARFEDTCDQCSESTDPFFSSSHQRLI